MPGGEAKELSLPQGSCCCWISKKSQRKCDVLESLVIPSESQILTPSSFCGVNTFEMQQIKRRNVIVVELVLILAIIWAVVVGTRRRCSCI